MYSFASQFRLTHTPYIIRAVSFFPGNNSRQGTDSNHADLDAGSDVNPGIHSASPSVSPVKKKHRKRSKKEPESELLFEPNMTTYYDYHADGSIMGYVVESVPIPPYTMPYPDPRAMYSTECYPVVPCPSTMPERPHQEVVTDSICAASESSQNEDIDHGYYSDETPSAEYIGYTATDPSTIDQIANNQPQGRPYPEVEEIRNLHDLHSLLPWIQPKRLHNAMFGPTLDIVEDGTGAIFAYKVPKKLLVLFCGRQIVTKFIRTLERENNENWRGGPKMQELRIPRGVANHVGVKILVAWMKRACYWEMMGRMHTIQVPKNLFAAISLARAMELFGLFRDAFRVDKIIARIHLERPLYPDEIKSIWLCLPKDSRYTYRMIQNLHEQLSEYENGNVNALRGAEEVLEFLEQQPKLNARVRDLGMNEKFEPVFGTKWCKNLAEKEQMKRSKLDSEPEQKQRMFGILRILPASPGHSLEDTASAVENSDAPVQW